MSSAFGWGDIGHGAVGYIAQGRLSPAAKRLVYDIIGPEPLAVSSVYPDQVRSDKRYAAFSPFHFVEIPYDQTGLDPAKRVDHDSDTIIQQAPALLTGDKLSRTQKMVLIRYLAHVVGDVHPPLHVGNGQDRGGNLCDVDWMDPDVRFDRGAHEMTYRRTNLHTVWDEDLIRYVQHEFQRATGGGANGQKRWFGYLEMGDLALKENAAIDFEKVTKDPPTVWYQESRDLHKIAYPNVAPYGMENPPYCKRVDPRTGKVVNGSYRKELVPKIEMAYIQRALPVLRKQVVLAGYRLAGMLNAMAEKARIAPADEAAQKLELDALLLKNPKP